jgi:hypothetical protein
LIKPRNNSIKKYNKSYHIILKYLLRSFVELKRITNELKTRPYSYICACGSTSVLELLCRFVMRILIFRAIFTKLWVIHKLFGFQPLTNITMNIKNIRKLYAYNTNKMHFIWIDLKSSCLYFQTLPWNARIRAPWEHTSKKKIINKISLHQERVSARVCKLRKENNIVNILLSYWSFLTWLQT